MRETSKSSKRAGQVGLLTAAAVLACVTLARGDPTAAAPLKPYPMKKCVVDGKKLGKCGEPRVIAWQGQEVKLCCEQCVPKFEKDRAKYLKKINRAEARAAWRAAQRSEAAARDQERIDW